MSDYPFIPAARHGGIQHGCDRVVIHRAECPLKAGSARATARYFQNGSGGRAASAHYVVDPIEVVQCLPENVVGYHAPPNERSIGVELCGYTAVDDWHTPEAKAMVRLAVDLVAGICRRWDVPAVYIDRTGLLANKRGITTHLDVSLAWHRTTHTDPGPGFAAGDFAAQVAAAQHATPPAPTSEEDDMLRFYTTADGKGQALLWPDRHFEVVGGDTVKAYQELGLIHRDEAGRRLTPAQEAVLRAVSAAAGH